MLRIQAILLLCLFSAASVALAERVLYLKDGSTLETVQYEIRGDRVRYLDPLDKEWAELPASLVDWEKTRSKEANSPAPAVLRKGESVSLGPPARARGHAIGGDLFVPNQEGVYSVSGAQVRALVQSATILNRNRARQILNAVSLPIFKNQTEVRLNGEQSPVRFSAGSRDFYFRIDSVSEVDVQLLRLEPRKGKRVVSRIEQGAITGRAQKARAAMAVQSEVIEESLLRITVVDLPPGEYAFWLSPRDVELKKGQVLAEMGVWDFGVDLGQK